MKLISGQNGAVCAINYLAYTSSCLSQDILKVVTLFCLAQFWRPRDSLGGRARRLSTATDQGYRHAKIVLDMYT
jgi:hypothetical protein